MKSSEWRWGQIGIVSWLMEEQQNKCRNFKHIRIRESHKKVKKQARRTEGPRLIERKFEFCVVLAAFSSEFLNILRFYGTKFGPFTPARRCELQLMGIMRTKRTSKSWHKSPSCKFIFQYFGSNSISTAADLTLQFDWIQGNRIDFKGSMFNGSIRTN